jgi:hypothetical protein
MDTTTMLAVYKEVVTQCANSCTDVPSTLAHIEANHREWMTGPPGLEGYALRVFLETLNYAAIREHRRVLRTIMFVNT